MFLHAGVLHFLSNFIGFLQVGSLVERTFGWWRVSEGPRTHSLFNEIFGEIFFFFPQGRRKLTSSLAAHDFFGVCFQGAEVRSQNAKGCLCHSPRYCRSLFRECNRECTTTDDTNTIQKASINNLLINSKQDTITTVFVF